MWVVLTWALAIALTGCSPDLIGPPPGEPDPVVLEVSAPAVADSLWASLDDCADTPPAISPAELRWYRVEAEVFSCVDAPNAFGCWLAPADIYMSGWVYDEREWSVARHEMLHAWLGVPGHEHAAWESCAEPGIERHVGLSPR